MTTSWRGPSSSRRDARSGPPDDVDVGSTRLARGARDQVGTESRGTYLRWCRGRCTAGAPRGLDQGLFPRAQPDRPTIRASSSSDARSSARWRRFRRSATSTMRSSSRTTSSTASGANIYTSSLETAMRAATELQAGTVWINDPLKDNDAAPFGGFEMSGLGRELGSKGSALSLRPSMSISTSRSRRRLSGGSHTSGRRSMPPGSPRRRRSGP